VATGAVKEIMGEAKKAISRAFFSAPRGRRDRSDGIINSHHHQYPNTMMEISL